MDTPRSALRELNDVGRVGRLALTFVWKHGRTVIGDCYSEIPHKITRPYYAEDPRLAHLILMNSTAGLFGGDRSDIEIQVQSGAQVVITSQASTKVHPGPGPAEQRIRLHVEEDAVLHFYNDPLIPFAGSRLKQRIAIHLAKGSRLYFWDGFVAGRVERGEAWAFQEFDSETRLEQDSRLIFLDRFNLTRAASTPASSWAMNDFHYLGTGLIFDPQVTVDPIQSATPEAGVDQPFESLIVIRALARDGASFRDLERRLLGAVFDQRGEIVPGLRKN